MKLTYCNMKTLFILLAISLLSFSCTSKSDNGKANNAEPLTISSLQSKDSIEGLIGYWAIDQLIGIEFIADSVPERASFFRIEKVKKGAYPYGDHVSFDADGTFICSYSAPCGNDCFPTTYGRYKAVDSKRILFQLDRVGQRGYCESVNKTVDINLGVFDMVRTDSTFMFSLTER